jgi:hypothetical protein
VLHHVQDCPEVPSVPLGHVLWGSGARSQVVSFPGHLVCPPPRHSGKNRKTGSAHLWIPGFELASVEAQAAQGLSVTPKSTHISPSATLCLRSSGADWALGFLPAPAL